MSKSALAAALRRVADGIALTFCKLARIQFAAPWRLDKPRGC